MSVTTKRTVSVFGSRARLPVHDQAADPERPPLRRLLRRDLRRREEEHEVRLERVEHERGGDAEHGEARADPGEAALARLHALPVGSRIVCGGALRASSIARRMRVRRTRQHLGDDRDRDAPRTTCAR